MFVLEIISFLSLSLVLYLFGVVLPRVPHKDGRISRTTHWVLNQIEDVDHLINVFTEKFLRRIKVTILRVDNFVSKKLGKYKKGSNDDLDSGLGS